MTLAEPLYLLLLVIPILYGVLVVLQRSPSYAQPLTGVPATVRMPRTWRVLWVVARPWFQIGILCLIIVALARPVGGKRPVMSDADAVDIALVLDVSSSMRQKDLAPNTTRIEVVRRFADAFVDARSGDRIALVTFARYSRVVAPLTFDRGAIQKLVSRMRTVSIQAEDGTAIGVGLGTAVRRLRESEAKSKVIVLLTDGENNTGQVKPLEAADLAAKHGIRVHTILAGIGTHIPNPFGRSRTVEPRSGELEEIAGRTGGQFFRARSAEALARVGAEIDKMEKTPVQKFRIHVEDERYRRALFPALLALLFVLLVEAVLVRVIP